MHASNLHSCSKSVKELVAVKLHFLLHNYYKLHLSLKHLHILSVFNVVTLKSYPYYVGEVYYSNDACRYCIDLHVTSDAVIPITCGGPLSEYEGIEVIGNIYQNPQLTVKINEN